MSSKSTSAVRSVPKDALMWRVLDYTNANPTEVLTRSDIAAKFDVAASTVDSMLAPAVAAGMLKRDHDTPDGTVWRHPSKRGAFPRPFTPSLTAVARAGRRTRSAIQHVNFNAIVIESDVPITEQPKVGSQWVALFDRMKAGDSFKLPSRSSAALSHAKLSYCKLVLTARFLTRKVSDTETRIWRIA